MQYRNKIFCGQAVQALEQLPDGIAQTCVTSPPYFGLRNYEAEGQLGLERTPEEFIGGLLPVMAQVHRVLHKTGTLFLNIGDSYSSGGRGYADTKMRSKNTYQETMGWHSTPGLKRKNLCGIPWRLAFAMQGFAVLPTLCLKEWADVLAEAIATQDWELVKIVQTKIRTHDLLQGLKHAGWFLRQDIIWSKPNPMPKSVTDRCTKSHEYVFLFSKSEKYYFDADAIKEPMADITRNDYRMKDDEYVPERKERNQLGQPGRGSGLLKPKVMMPAVGGSKHKNLKNTSQPPNTIHRTRNERGEEFQVRDGLVNKKSVWPITTGTFKDAHFAVFPNELPRTCIKAGSRPGDLVLDPFMGSGTTAEEAQFLDRDYCGVELNPNNFSIINRRLHKTFGLFAQRHEPFTI